MSVSNFEELYDHLEHDVEVVEYTSKKGESVNVAIECNTCNEVLIDYDAPDHKKTS